MTENKKLTIGLFGFGVVGEGIYDVLQHTPTLNAQIKKICIRHPEKERNAPGHLFTTDKDELLNDPEINVIVELIDDADAAYTIVTTAFRNKKAVVSANKKMIAEHLSELLSLQKEQDVSFLYEAAVCGSVPVIRNLEEYYDNDLLSSFAGIINGSTNFILTRMSEDGLNYSDALSEAQSLGFAESNPALDVEGRDAANKLTIVLKHAYGLICSPENILRLGITDLHEADSRFANEQGYRIKLVANAGLSDQNKVSAYVLPTFVTKDNLLYSVRNEFNGALIGSKLADEQFLYGKGAGRFPTASAVLSDIAALRYGYRYEYKKSGSGNTSHISLNKVIKVYVSFDSKGDVDENDFTTIDVNYRSAARQYLIGTIPLKALKESKWLQNSGVSLVAFGD